MFSDEESLGPASKEKDEEKNTKNAKEIYVCIELVILQTERVETPLGYPRPDVIQSIYYLE